VQKAGEKSSNNNNNTPINDRANLPLKAVKYTPHLPLPQSPSSSLRLSRSLSPGNNVGKFLGFLGVGH